MLCAAIADAHNGLIDAALGGEVIKRRIARKGKGKSGGYRVLIAFRDGECAVFLFGFAKSERADVRPDQLALLKLYAQRWLGLDDVKVSTAVSDGELREVHCD
jgi:hypothetical protein